MHGHIRCAACAAAATIPRRRQLWVLVLLTLLWGLNWPVMKLGVSGTPAAAGGLAAADAFARLSIVFGLPVLAAAPVAAEGALPRAARAYGARWSSLAIPNMMVWHVADHRSRCRR